MPPSSIEFDAATKVFHFLGVESSYAFGIAEDGDPQHLHWGRRLTQVDLDGLTRNWKFQAWNTLKETKSREFPGFGNNDLRCPALLMEHEDGSRLSAFAYESHEILQGKPQRPGWPGTSTEDCDGAETLVLRLADGLKGQSLSLFYAWYPKRDVMVRWAEVKQGSGNGKLRKFMAASLDFSAGEYFAVRFPGDWARERHMEKHALAQGLFRSESRRGMSSAQMSPFMMVTRGLPNEEQGDAWSFSLLYSGNWLMEAEVHQSGRLRVNAGLNDFDFCWQLAPGEVFAGPECVLAYSSRGLGALSRGLHRLVRERVLRAPWKDQIRPVLLNTWESHFFNFKHEDITRMAVTAKALGLELLVLDDGWFGKRDDDTSSLGDWFENTPKLPKGIKGLAKDVHDQGLKFGLWFEPEAVNPKSDLYRAHPDWALKVPGRPSTYMRNQMVLDLSRQEVRDYLSERLAHFVSEAGLDYIKWDMNRPLWETGNPVLPAGRQAEISHRYALGVYEVMARLRDQFPKLLVEGCAGGGGRFDWGQLCYHSQYWASDNTDGLDRVFIQFGGSYFLPAVTQGSHISVVPNHQNGRVTPLRFRAHVAMSGNLGLELDPDKLSVEEKKEVAEYIKIYKEIAPLVQKGDFYRLENPYEGPRAAWGFVSSDKQQALLFVFQALTPFKGMDPLPVAMRGLDPARQYRVKELNEAWSGQWLMSTGLVPGFEKGDFQSVLYRLNAE